jgi:prophage regulatory protein
MTDLNQALQRLIDQVAREIARAVVREWGNANTRTPPPAMPLITPAPPKIRFHPSSLPSTGFLRLKQIIGDRKANPPIAGPIPVSVTTGYEGIKTGRFPKPVKHGASAFWRVDDIRSCIDRMNANEPA